jgi:predicted amidophosphoribosyltransferase
MIDLKVKDKSKAAFKAARRALVSDIYTVSSTFLGYDEENGRPQFDNTYSTMGGFVCRLKKHNAQDPSVIPQIVDLLEKDKDFLSLITDIDVIVPIPPSKKIRAIQPTIAVAQEMSNRFNKPMQKDFILSSNTEQVKAMEIAERYDAVKKNLSLTPDVIFDKKAKILLFDDVLESASTIKAVMDILISNGYADISILVLTIKRTSELE